MPKVKIYVSTGMVGSRREIEFDMIQDDLDQLSPEELEKEMMEHMLDLIEWNFEVKDD